VDRIMVYKAGIMESYNLQIRYFTQARCSRFTTSFLVSNTDFLRYLYMHLPLRFAEIILTLSRSMVIRLTVEHAQRFSMIEDNWTCVRFFYFSTSGNAWRIKICKKEAFSQYVEGLQHHFNGSRSTFRDFA
jgi:hypothetical protein